MKAHVLCAFVLLTAGASTSPPFRMVDTEIGNLCTKEGQFCINRQTSSGVCKVQEATEAQAYGPNLAGPFETRAEATSAMCKNYYDPGTSDQDKCSDVLPRGVCG